MRAFDSRPLNVVILAAFTALAIAGCSTKNAATSVTDSSATTIDSAAPATSSVAETSHDANTAASLTPGDIDKWQLGMTAELTAVQDAGTKLKNAKTGEDSLNAVAAANETATLSAGAKAAGVDERRYQLISNVLSSLAGDMTPVENEMDAAKMPAALIASMNEGRAKSLAAASVGQSQQLLDALRPRAVVLRKQALALVGARIKAAGLAQ